MHGACDAAGLLRLVDTEANTAQDGLCGVLWIRLVFMNCQVIEYSLDSNVLTRLRGNAPAVGSERTLADGKEYYLRDEDGATLVHDKASMMVLGTLNLDDNTVRPLQGS